MRTKATALRALGPYLLVELLLPGGTLIALLMWLSQRFLRGGLGSVRQYALAPKLARPVIMAKPYALRSKLCLCVAHSAWVRAWRALRQFCTGRTSPSPMSCLSSRGSWGRSSSLACA